MLSAQPLHFPHHLLVFGLDRALLGYEDQIDACGEQQFVSPEGFPHQPFYAIAPNGTPELARRGYAHSRRAWLAPRQYEHEEAVGVELATGPLYAQELASSPEPLALREALVRRSYFLATATVSRLRPLRRRRDSVN